MRFLDLFPHDTRIDFAGKHRLAFFLSLLLILLSLASLTTRGLNLGLDFTGGVAIEVHAPQAVDLAPLRATLGALALGEVQLQNFGSERDLLIRVQPAKGGAMAAQQAAAAVRAALGEGFEYRRVEVVGPSVSRELLRDGIIATLLALVGIATYVAVRFEWQFGVSALLATAHDVLATLGMFSVLGLEFNMTAIAALLTLAGYSINDTIVVFDRMRESMRRYKAASLPEIINLSVNSTLTRTMMTALTTALAVLPLLLFGGPTLLNFSAAFLFGLVAGTFSSVYVAAALLIYMKPVRHGLGIERGAGLSEGG